MEAPDKIYLQRNTTTDLYDEFWPEWFEDTNHPDSDICYIRKDALLKWLEGKMTIEGATEGFVGGYDTALKDVIDKIKEI